MSDLNNELDGVRRLRQAVERLPRELRPARDLWPEIAGRLEERAPEEFSGGWWRLAAAVVLVAGGLMAALILRPEAPLGGSPVVEAVRGSGPAMAAVHMRKRDGVVHAHNDLVEVVARRSGGLEAAAAATLAAGLADLERATADIERALAENPSDRRLRLALAAAYRRESQWTSRLSHA